MTRTDRIILGALLVGVWALTLVTAFGGRPVYARQMIDASEIDGLENFIERVVEEVVEGCAVEGQVYIYDLERGGAKRRDAPLGWGPLQNGEIDC